MKIFVKGKAYGTFKGVHWGQERQKRSVHVSEKHVQMIAYYTEYISR